MIRSSSEDIEILEAALMGFQQMRDQIEQKISDLRDQIAASGPGASSQENGGGSRAMSAAARRRIALAQKKRWAAYKAEHGESEKPKPQKRVLSAAGRARIIAATKKRWAAFRKAKQQAKSA